MSENLEIEFKNELTKEEMNQLISFFNLTDTDFFIQENIYFDTDDLLLKQFDSALRVRIKNNTYELTLKEPVEAGLLETNQMITEKDYQQLIDTHTLPDGEVSKRVFTITNTSSIKEIARLTTKRATTPYKNQEVFLDESTYYGHTDYELELETHDYQEGLAIFLELLQQFAIPKRKTENKIKRAFQFKLSLASLISNKKFSLPIKLRDFYVNGI
jgi:uncharacterized protein YjbK